MPLINSDHFCVCFLLIELLPYCILVVRTILCQVNSCMFVALNVWNSNAKHYRSKALTRLVADDFSIFPSICSIDYGFPVCHVLLHAYSHTPFACPIYIVHKCIQQPAANRSSYWISCMAWVYIWKVCQLTFNRYFNLQAQSHVWDVPEFSISIWTSSRTYYFMIAARCVNECRAIVNQRRLWCSPIIFDVCCIFAGCTLYMFLCEVFWEVEKIEST